MSDSVVIARDVCKSYGAGEGRTDALKDVSFEIKQGEFVSIMGPSGCGKSTLLYLVGGLDAPTSGKVLTCGRNMAAMNDFTKSRMRRRKIGFVFQFFNLVQNLTVEENILLPLVMDGRPVRRYKNRVMELLGMMGIAEKRNVIPSKLSGGQQQKVSIARAVITDPLLLLADEPTGNLDSCSGEEIMAHFCRINEELGISIVMVTHSAESAAYSRRLIRMRDGTIESDLQMIKEKDGN